MRQHASNMMLGSGATNGTTFIEQFPEWWEFITIEQEGEKPATMHGGVQVCVQGMEEARQCRD
jgi:hypothetical protein